MMSTARRSLLPGAIAFHMIAMIALALPDVALAQVNVKYTLSLPVVKAVPNPCTGGFELLNATTSITINTVESLTAFNLSIAATSSGTGSDAKADGTLIAT